MILALRFLHIISGVFWVGGSLFAARFLMPSLKAAGPAAGPVLAELGKRRIPTAMMGAALVNVASGIWLMMLVSGGAPGVWMRSSMGRTLGIGGGLAILALLLGMAVGMPANAKMARISAAARQRGGPPTAEEAAELERLQARSALTAMSASALLFLSTGAMAVARYVP
jgi:uncharacterized membrane protein